MKATEHVRRGDPVALIAWMEGREADPEFAELVEEALEASRRRLRLG